MNIRVGQLFACIFCFLLFFGNISVFAQTIAINEVMAWNVNGITDSDDEHQDWIEIYNYGNAAVNLKGIALSDDSQKPFKWVFPDYNLKPKAYLLIWASGKNHRTIGKPFHTNFSIDSNGEEIFLTASDGSQLDYLPPTSVPANYSYGRYPNGSGQWVYYNLSTTPGAPNSSNKTVHPPAPPAFSHSSGFYSAPFSLALTHPNKNARIIYSIDGSMPSTENLDGVSYKYKNSYPEYPGQEYGQLLENTYASIIYESELYVSDRSSAPNKLASISSTWHYDPDYLPDGPIRKATVVRAMAVVDGVASSVKTETYFVSDHSAFSSNLPIVSISLNEDALFDYYDGIYVAGEDFDNWRKKNPNEVTNGHRSANYRRTGASTEKNAVFQYFIDGEKVVDQNIGLRLHGSFSKSFQNKTFRLYARSEYDTLNSFDYPFFGPTNSSGFKRLILRNSGNDAGNVWIGGALVHTVSPAVYFRDAFIHKMVEHLHFDTQDYLPVITYVNGEYWGILNMRERYDEHYLERKYGILDSELDLLEGNASVKIGSNSHYKMTYNFIADSDLSNNNNYAYAKTLIDTDNFIDYQISQIYARNTDWPGNNIDYFRKRTSSYSPDAPYGQDGRWRWLMFDTDHGFGWSGENSFTHNSLQNASKGGNWSTLILNKLLDNESFRVDFINRYADLLNTAFLPERLIALIDGMAANIANEIPKHRERWNTLPDWEENVEHMREFANQRPVYARLHLREKFDLPRSVNVVLDVSDFEHGYLHINTIDVNELTPGVDSKPYPWTGEYFQNVPITITAVPKPGYKFCNWSGASNGSNPEIELNPNNNISLKANFEPLQENDYELIYFWLFDNRIVNDYPLQKINSTYSVNNSIAGLAFSSSYGKAYPFHPNHPAWRKGSLERQNAPTPLNYYPQAYYGADYEMLDMKGIQVKGPFAGSGFENSLVFTLPTTGYENIVLSFAAKVQGTSKKLKVDYYNNANQQWDSNSLIAGSCSIEGEYQVFNFDFSNVKPANNNHEFMVRIRFDGVDLILDDDNKVIFNNIAVKGTKSISNSFIEPIANNLNDVSVYPTLFTDNLYVSTPISLIGTAYKLFDLNGSLLKTGTIQDQNTVLNLEHLKQGVYLFHIIGQSGSMFKIVKL